MGRKRKSESAESESVDGHCHSESIKASLIIHSEKPEGEWFVRQYERSGVAKFGMTKSSFANKIIRDLIRRAAASGEDWEMSAE